jgi:benzoyl-CoA reductase subunit D
MITVGIDVGAKNIKAMALRDQEILGRAMLKVEFDRQAACQKAFEQVLAAADISEDKVDTVLATGAGKKAVTFAQKSFTVVACVAKGIHYLLPSVRTAIDVGAEEARAVRLDENGKLIESAVNEKCGAGAGAFVESMARAIEVEIEDFASLSLQSTRVVPINAQCVIFAESEVVSLIHSDVTQEDLARAVHEAMAARVSSMAHRIKMAPDIAITGGVALNVGFVKAVETALGEKALVPPDPVYVTALGAALLGF